MSRKAKTRRWPGLLIFAGLLLLGYIGNSAGNLIHRKVSPPPVTSAQAIAYVKSELGRPYIWGGPTMPGTSAGFDCSGLIFKAYHWGMDLRTSQDQWARLPHVDKPKPGDLVFFHGLLSEGEKPPGHVGIYIRKNLIIDAYAAGFPVEYDSFGTSGSKDGLEVVWGYASP